MDLPVNAFAASGYRSLKQIAYPVSTLDVLVGANGVGKSNLYRALELLRAAAANTLGRDLAEEGLASTMWAGPRRKGDARIRLSVGLTAPGSRRLTYEYAIEVGFPPPVSAAFGGEPHVKTESLSLVGGSRPVRLVDRDGPSVMARDEDGRRQDVDIDLLASETLLGRLEDPARYPALDLVRRTLLEWRFHHDLRTDAGSPIRRACVAVPAPTLDADGGNLAAVFATLRHIRGETLELDRAVAEAFGGAELVVPPPGDAATFGLRYPDFPHRVFEARELSDGTLRFLALAGALLSYRLPPFIALNEPESSLHPDLMRPLARMIVKAAERTQVWLVTHSEALAEAVAAGGGAVRSVRKVDGATTIDGLTRFGSFRDDEA